MQEHKYSCFFPGQRMRQLGGAQVMKVTIDGQVIIDIDVVDQGRNPMQKGGESELLAHIYALCAR